MNLKPWLLMLPLVYSLSGGEICTHDSKPWRLGAMEKREQSLQCIEYSPEIGKVLEISMIPAVFSYIELNYRNRFPVATNENELKKLRFSLELLARPAEAVSAVSVRLIDATGEFFQFRATPFKLASGTWSRISIPIANPTSVWGGNKNRKIDYPVRFSGLTVDCRKETAEPVILRIDNIEFLR